MEDLEQFFCNHCWLNPRRAVGRFYAPPQIFREYLKKHAGTPVHTSFRAAVLGTPVYTSFPHML